MLKKFMNAIKSKKVGTLTSLFALLLMIGSTGMTTQCALTLFGQPRKPDHLIQKDEV